MFQFLMSCNPYSIGFRVVLVGARHKELISFIIRLSINQKHIEIMKKLLGALCFVSFLISCDNGNSKHRNTALQTQNEILSSENERLKKELENQKETKIGDNVQKIGRWLDNRPGSDTQLFLNKDLDSNKYYLIHKYSDGSTSKDEVQVTKEKGLVRFQEINTNHIEWYIIEKNGDLSMYSQSGKFATALCF